MKNTGKMDLRLPDELKKALERERKRMSKLVGQEVKLSFVVRALLERALRDSGNQSKRAAA